MQYKRLFKRPPDVRLQSESTVLHIYQLSAPSSFAFELQWTLNKRETL